MNLKYIIILITIYLSKINSYSLPAINFRRNNITKKIDKDIIDLTKPAALNFIMNPLVGIIDSYWISNLGGPIQLAGQGFADQVLSLTFGLLSFMPLVLPPLISEFKNQNNNERIIEYMNNSIILSLILGSILAINLNIFSSQILNFFLSNNSPMFIYATQYLRFRSIALPLMLINSVIFSVFRGIFDFNSAIKVNIQSQILNLILDPILMKYYGIGGAAIASSISDLYCTINYIYLLNKKKMIQLKIQNFKNNIIYLLKNGIFVQTRAISGNLSYFLINKQIVKLDGSGIVSAAHILSCKILELLSISYVSLSSVSSILVPKYQNNLDLLKILTNRLFQFGLIIAFFQGSITYICKSLFIFFTKDINVFNKMVSLLPLILLYSSLSGFSTIVDGVLQGKQEYKLQSYGSIFNLFIFYFTLNYCKNIYSIWSVIIFITAIKIPINFKYLKSKLF